MVFTATPGSEVTETNPVSGPVYVQGAAPGDTLFLRIGDAFAWACLALLAALTLTATLRRKPAL